MPVVFVVQKITYALQLLETKLITGRLAVHRSAQLTVFVPYHSVPFRVLRDFKNALKREAGGKSSLC
jgi:uncharacterized protein YqiB (DUF1249 family)